jgi:hypothetical protein
MLGPRPGMTTDKREAALIVSTYGMNFRQMPALTVTRR